MLVSRSLILYLSRKTSNVKLTDVRIGAKEEVGTSLVLIVLLPFLLPSCPTRGGSADPSEE